MLIFKLVNIVALEASQSIHLKTKDTTHYPELQYSTTSNELILLQVIAGKPDWADKEFDAYIDYQLNAEADLEKGLHQEFVAAGCLNTHGPNDIHQTIDRDIADESAQYGIDLHICSFCGIKEPFEIALQPAYSWTFLTLINIFIPHFKIP